MKTIVQENKDNSNFKLICTIIWPKKIPAINRYSLLCARNLHDYIFNLIKSSQQICCIVQFFCFWIEKKT